MSTLEEQGLTLEQAFTEAETETTQTPPPTEIPTTETEQPPTPEPTANDETTTDADKWRKRLTELNFKNAKDARKWARDNCTDGDGKGEKIGAVGTAYRIINRLKFGNRPAQESKVCTFKIKKEEVPDDPPEIDLIEGDPRKTTTPPLIEGTLPTTVQPIQPPQPVQPAQLSEKMLAKASKSGWNALCDFSGAPEAYLSSEEAQDLAEYLHPVIQTRFPSVVNNPEVVAIIGAGSILAPKAKLIMDARKRRAQETELPPTPIVQSAEQTPAPEPQPVQQPKQPAQEVSELRNGKPDFYKKLGK